MACRAQNLIIILTPNLLPGPAPLHPAYTLNRAPYTESRPSPRHSLTTQPHLNLTQQSSPLKAAFKSEPAFDAESCGAKGIVPPRDSFVKAVTLLHYSISAHSDITRQTQCTVHIRAGLMRMQCSCAVVHMQGSCACSAEVLPTCAA